MLKKRFFFLLITLAGTTIYACRVTFETGMRRPGVIVRDKDHDKDRDHDHDNESKHKQKPKPKDRHSHKHDRDRD